LPVVRALDRLVAPHQRGRLAAAGRGVLVRIIPLPLGRAGRGAPAEARAGAADGSCSGTCCSARSQAPASASLGARQSPRGESEPPLPTLGALGIVLRLNWLWK